MAPPDRATGPSRGIVSLGECMVELARGSDGRYGLSYGGDTFNTAVYLARCGVDTAYATLLGDDPYSGGILALAREEGIAVDLIRQRPGRTAGLYLIETSPTGERSFHYWRDRAPARELFDATDDITGLVSDRMTRSAIVYLSGITLSLYPQTALDRLAAALQTAREAGAQIAMDGNFRPRGWGGDRNKARTVFERFWRLTDIALPSVEDEGLLWGDDDWEAAARRLESFGVREIVIKCGTDPARCIGTGTTIEVPLPAVATPVDTSAAGDSFNAAYLASRQEGADPGSATLAGHRLAAVVVQHRGAVVPRAATDTVLKPA
ncbi:MAG TPA: sugar kinase [Hyphomicrobiaceae bacterium]|nr:sugar kinase [Hyphomicrobiaceae bacterium]